MSLSPGARIGVYEVLGSLWAGGMGEVYRARDTKLGRDVALKILPAAFTAEADRVARFKREARLLASLNHPHIGSIYGFENAGDVPALVLELIEGDTLADRVRRGPLPLSNALAVAQQIADALDVAHGAGIIHRDLKPRDGCLTVVYDTRTTFRRLRPRATLADALAFAKSAGYRGNRGEWNGVAPTRPQRCHAAR